MAKTSLLCFAAVLLVYAGVNAQGSQQGGGIGPCPQVMACITQGGLDASDCSGLSQQLQCIAALKGTCEVKEDAITYADLQTRSTDVCEDLRRPTVGEIGNCSVMQQCFMGSELVQSMMGMAMDLDPSTLSQEELQKMYLDMQKRMLDSRTWCQYLELVSRCYVNNVDTCQLNTDAAASLRIKQQELSAKCGPGTGGAGSVGQQAQGLLLMLGSLVCWSLLHL